MTSGLKIALLLFLAPNTDAANPSSVVTVSGGGRRPSSWVRRSYSGSGGGVGGRGADVTQALARVLRPRGGAVGNSDGSLEVELSGKTPERSGWLSPRGEAALSAFEAELGA